MDYSAAYDDYYTSDEDFKPVSFLKVEYGNPEEEEEPEQIHMFDDYEALYCCTSCGKQFENETSLEHHMSNYHKTSHPCQICPEIFNSSRALASHRRTSHLTDPSVAPVIKRRKKGSADKGAPVLKRRKKGSADKTTSGPTTGTRSYRCGNCKLKFESLMELRQHRKSVHHTTFTCKRCTQKFETYSVLESHLLDCNTFICQFCNLEVPTKSALKYHKRKEHRENSYFCEQCGAQFHQMIYLNRHVASHHKASYDCPLCSESFKTFDEFSIHKRSKHSAEGLFLCDSCPKVLTSPSKYLQLKWGSE